MEPLIGTLSPGGKRARSTSAAEDDIPGLAIAVAVTSSTPSGTSTRFAAGTTLYSPMPPYSGRGKAKYTRRPSSSSPTPSTPGTSGSTLPLL